VDLSIPSPVAGLHVPKHLACSVFGKNRALVIVHDTHHLTMRDFKTILIFKRAFNIELTNFKMMSV
jgi:beta-lactamase regulating signal transducer with metallopeptidase domain